MQELKPDQFARLADAENYGKLWGMVQSFPKPYNFLVAGGAIRRTITGEKLEDGDIDLFHRTQKDHDEYKEKLKSHKGFKLISEKEHVDSFEYTFGNHKYEVQLIKIRFYPDAPILLDSFDYTIAQFAMDPNGPRFFCGDFSLYDLGRKRLAVNKIIYPLSSMRRLIKYTRQGYYACNGCLQTYINDLREIPEADFKDRNITYVD